MSLTLTITGTEALRDALAKLGPKAQEASAAALYQEAEAIMADSKENYVPVDTGALRDSGNVLKPEIVGTVISVTMSYGTGPSAEYAVPIHEDLTIHHPMHRRPGGGIYDCTGEAKYLERPLLAAASDLASRLAVRIGASLFRDRAA